MSKPIIVAWAALWLVCGHSFAAEAPLPPASAFRHMPAMESLVLSPNGQRIALVDQSGAVPAIQVLDLAKGTQVKRVNAPRDLDVHGLDWADDETLLIHHLLRPSKGVIESTTHEWLRTATMQVANGKSQVLLNYGGNLHAVSGTRLLALHPSKPGKVILSSLTTEGYRSDSGEQVARRNTFSTGHDLYEIDTLTGKDQVISWGTPYTTDWVVGTDGRAVARSEWFPKRGLYTVLHLRESEWVEIFRLETGEQPRLLGPSRDGAAVWMAATLGRKHLTIWRVPLFGPAPTLAIADESSDITRLVRDPYSQEVLGAWTGGLTPQLRWLDKQAEERVGSLRKTFGGQLVSLISRSADGDRTLVSVGARATPSVFYLVDFKRGTADVVGEEYPALVGVSLGEVRALTFKARDGSDVPAHLTLPPALRPEKLPLVVLDHKGSKGHEQSMFHPIAQFLATRGYAVLQLQHRETAGEADGKTGVDRWGGLLPGDAADGVRAMIDQGFADPARVCIVGYGSYVALAGAAFTPELYACAVSVNGVSDFPDLISYHRKSGNGLVKLLEESLGSANHEELAAKSPARAASSVRAPILLMHDTDQAVVPFDQSQIMFKALGALPPHELVKLPGESTRELRAESWLRALTEMERFLAKHLSARQPP